MKLELTKIKEEARLTKSFFFEPEKDVNWKPGQYFYFTLSHLTHPDSRGDTRHFTISSSPTEGRTIRLTTRIREDSGYKQSLSELPIGTVIEGSGPEGTFVFDEKEQGINLFIAGGIGITPYRSFIKYCVDKNLNLPIYLIYTNSDHEFVFQDELMKWQKERGFLKTEFIDSSKLGHLDEILLTKLINGWGLTPGKFTPWVTGSPDFVNAIEDLLDKIGVEPPTIRTEKFTGY